jgi:hypothetical protein
MLSEPDTPGAEAGRVMGTNGAGRGWHNLRELSRAFGEAAAKDFEIIQSVADVGGDADTIAVGMCECVLEGIE